jgi:hypothetical protein
VTFAYVRASSVWPTTPGCAIPLMLDMSLLR